MFTTIAVHGKRWTDNLGEAYWFPNRESADDAAKTLGLKPTDYFLKYI